MFRTGLAMFCSMGIIQANVALSAPSALQKQFQQLCNDVYQGAVIGNLDLSKLASPAVVSRIASETNGEGYAPKLSEIGAPKSLGVSEIVHLSYADVFVCQFRHETGFSRWNLAYSPMSQTISDFQMAMEKDPPKPKPEPQRENEPATTTAPSSASSDSPKPDNAPQTPTQSEACRMFPDLC